LLCAVEKTYFSFIVERVPTFAGLTGAVAFYDASGCSNKPLNYMPLPPSTIQQRKQRWVSFYDHTQPHSHIFIIRFAPGIGPRPYPNPDRVPARLEWIWQNYEWHLRRMEWLDDDSLPYIDMLTGTEIFGEAFGCPVFRPEDNMPFAQPFVQTPADAERITIPSLDVPPIARVFRMADELQRRAGPGALFRLVDFQSPMDVIGVIWEKTNLYLSALDQPEVILALSEKIRTFQVTFLEEWFRRYGHEFIAHWPDYYMPSGISLSVDEVGAVSQNMFTRFFMPELTELCNHFGGLGIHCCANARHQWRNFQNIPGLRLINISQSEDMVRKAYPFFADAVCQWNYGWDPAADSLESWAAQIPANARIVFDVTAQTRDEALSLSERLAKICHP
jgi:hypothetical protein